MRTDSQGAALPKATPERVSTFSDAVFAVLITVLVLDIRVSRRVKR